MTLGEAAAFFSCAPEHMRARISAAGISARAYWNQRECFTEDELMAAENAANIVQIIVEMHMRYSQFGEIEEC